MNHLICQIASPRYIGPEIGLFIKEYIKRSVLFLPRRSWRFLRCNNKNLRLGDHPHLCSSMNLGPIVKQKFWLEKQLEKALEKQLEKRFEISYTGKRQKINSLHMSQNQKGM